MTFNKSDFFASNGLPRTGSDSAQRVTKTAKKDFGLDKKTPATAPPPPVIEDTAGRQQDEADRIRMRKGRAAAMLTQGSPGTPLTASKTLLGG